MSNKPKIIGITGGISSGKSTITRMLASMGAEHIDADEMCHRLFLRDDVKKKIIDIFGQAVKDNYGEIDRNQLAAIVFQNKDSLDNLCSILHPIVIKQIYAKIDAVEHRGRRHSIVIDAALLEESGLSVICDYIVFVNAGKDQRVKRSQIARHWREGELERRESFQMDLEEKKNKADYIIDNNFSVDNAFLQVKKFWQLYIEDK
ncbi:MAG: dephospho-CoA kinase [Candidatus Kuenenia sp.]|nr:dephospho-CoA kinase [Candidatus Kuenenia hertensis]